MIEKNSQPTVEEVQERLREYATAFYRYLKDPTSEKHLEMDRLESALIGDITANAPNGAVERAAFEIYEAADELNVLALKLTDALAAAMREARSPQRGGDHEPPVESPAPGRGPHTPGPAPASAGNGGSE